MVRLSRFVMAGLLLALISPVQAAEESPAGNYKFSFLNRGQMITGWILKLDQKDGKLVGQVVGTAEGAPQGATVDDVALSGDQLSFNLVIQGQKLSFEGKLPGAKDKKILGSLVLGRQIVPAELEPTKLATFDAFEAAKEIVAKGTVGPEFFQAVLTLLGQAAAKKAPIEEVRSWANKGFTASEAYGKRWQREMALSIAQGLSSDEGYAALVLEYARKAQRLVDPSETTQSKLRVMTVLGNILTKIGKKAEAAEINKEADALYLKGMPPFKPEKYAGQPKPDQRRVLVELFTGAECPPCVAADVAFDALEKTYPGTAVVLLEYHLHIPRPDPLTNEDSEARAKFYGDEVEGTPTILFNGKLNSKASGGGGLDDAKEKYQDYREIINTLLAKTTAVKLQAEASRKGDKIDIRASASDVPGDKVRLRLALVEEVIRYPGGNQMRFHHHVVRDMPGGAEGVAVKDKSAKQELTVDLGQVKGRLEKYLAEFSKKEKATFHDRPVDLKNLYLIAFLQNDETKEVLQSVQVKIGGEGEAEK